MPRQCDDLISTGLELMQAMPAPDNFKLATILSVLSTLLGRRVWVDTEVDLPRAYANLFVMLVAPPGVAKDVVISWASRTLNALQEQLGPANRIWASAGTSISPKGIYDALGSSDHCEQVFRHGGKPHAFRSLTFHIGEMSTLMHDYDQRLIGVLNDLYNCAPLAADRIRGQEVNIPNPHVVLLIGNQPATLFRTLPEEAFHMGFTSRLMIFQATVKQRRKLFNLDSSEAPADRTDLYNRFLGDLHDVTLMTGSFRLTREAGDWLNDFAINDPYPVPTDRWVDYNPRRILHVQKLAMICSAAERSDRKLQVSHCERAFEIMRGYERDLPKLFDGVVSSSGFSTIYGEIHSICEKHATPIIVKDKLGTERLSHYEITHLKLSTELSRTNEIYKVDKLYGELTKSGFLTLKVVKVGDDRGVIPVHPRTYIVNARI